MNTRQNFLITLLLISAGILTAMLVISLNDAPPAEAGTASVSARDYIMVPGKASNSDEILYVIHKRAQRVIVYNVDKNKGFQLLSRPLDLRLLFGARR